MRLPFQKNAPARSLRQPARPAVFHIPSVQVGALYRAARTGGDFYDYAAAGDSRLLLMLLDIAGQRQQALDIAAAVQDVFRAATDLFLIDDMNEAVAISQLTLDVNRAIMTAANGVRCAPGFLACYNQVAGTLCYINAGHTPGLLKEAGGTTVLGPTGLPLGLFSHATHDAQICAFAPGTALVLVSRGLVEAKAASEEFGLERARQLIAAATLDANQLCSGLLDAVRQFVEDHARRGLLRRGNHALSETDPLGSNDVTAVALVRSAAAAVGA